MKTDSFDDFTNLYPVQKTLRFELKPVGKTKETFEGWVDVLQNSTGEVDSEGNLLMRDKKIKDAYLVIKPIMDKLHEQFIEKSLTSDEAKRIDFSEYFDAFENGKRDDLSNIENKLRAKIGETYNVAGGYFSDKIANVIKKGQGSTQNKSNKKSSFECLTDSKMCKYLSANVAQIAKENDIDEQVLANHISRFDGFWGYLDGYNINRKNYYATKNEQSTAVATRIVHENLPTFCGNALRFKNCQKEYLGIYQYLKDNNRETKIKDSQGNEVEVEPITETVFQIKYFNECLSQKQIEEYNRVMGNYNLLVNLYNQAQGSKKIDEFEFLYKQIGCGKKKSMFAMLIKDKQSELTAEQKKEENDGNAILTVETLLKRAQKAGDIIFGGGNNDAVISTIPAFIRFLQECDNWDGIYMSSTAVNKLSGRYFSNWHSIKDKLKDAKAKACITYDKNREEQIKLRDAVELSGLFDVLDTEQSEHVFKASLFKNDDTNVYRDVLDAKLKPSKNLINLMCFDMKRNMELFLAKSKDIVALEKFKDDDTPSGEEDQTIRQIKEWFDAATAVMRIVQFFAVRKSKVKGNIPNVTMGNALSNLLYCDDMQWFKWYDLIRNYLTKRPQDDVKKDKLKLNFDSSSLLKGWETDYNTKACLLFERDGTYYLAINKYKLTADEKQRLVLDADNNLINRIIIYFQKVDEKNSPRLFIRSKGNKFAPAVEEYQLPVQEIIDIYDNRLFKTGKGKVDFNEIKESLHKLIDYYKLGFSSHESFKPFKFEWRDSKDYNSIDEFYHDVQTSCYQVQFEKTNWDTLMEFVNEEKLYLFEIYNKDFAPGVTGKPNMHTMYWKMLFDSKNLEDVVFKLDGQGAEIFMRKPIAKESRVKHGVGSKLVNKKDRRGDTIPEGIYREIYLYANGRTNSISAEAQRYIDEENVVIKDAKYEIIKDKRFYGETKYMFHCPITINFKAKSGGKSIDSKINNALQQSDNLQFIGIDRGEKHLVYSCTIDKECRIIKCGHYDVINGTDYVQKLEAVADQRSSAKTNWQAENKIADLKRGYLSHVVHSLVEEVVKDGDTIAPHSYVVLEDLNTEMKRGRQKIEKQVYQNMETALAKKLNFVVDKNAKQGELGSVSKALQLTPLINNYQDIEGEKKFGVMLYTRANYTSVTDPATGWRKTIYIKNGKDVDMRKQIIEKFSDFGFDGKDYYFEYIEAHAGHTWRIYSGKNGNPLPRFQNKKQLLKDKNIWAPEQINVADILDKLFVRFDKTKSFKQQMEQGVELEKIDGRRETAWQSLRYALDLIQQIRNTGIQKDDDNFLYSPVRNGNGEHFDTRNHIYNGELSAIVDADANGAYNIARKGLIMDAHIKHWITLGSKEKSDLDLFVSDKEWDLWLLNRDQWERDLGVFALRSKKENRQKKNNR